MPGSDSTGISRKVEGEGERKKLKEMVKEMTIPEGIGYIIRTEAVGRTLEELQKDLDSLVARYNEIVEQGKAHKGPALIYQEHAVVIRTIRDYFSADIDEVLVDSKDVCKEAKEFFKEVMPSFEKRVKMHQEKRPIFSRYQIEEQIDQIYEKKVLLKSGGSLVIEPTEALVSIDVNSGKSTGERGVEDTAFKTNMEAADEVARQLRLRDLGGLIVIDFIDMRDSKRIREVEKTLKDALKADKARVTVGRISQFGMLEMSRQRIKQTLEQGSILDCPHCSGRGKVKGVENMAISFLRKVHAAAAKGNAAEVHGSLPLEVAYYLLNRKKRDLAQIENDYDIEVTIKGKPSFLMNQLELEVVKREKHHDGHHEEKPGRERAAVSHTPAIQPEQAEVVPVEAAAEAAAEAGEKKKRTRSRKKKGEVETPVVETAAVHLDEPALEPAAEAEEPDTEAAGEVHADEGAEHGKKKRRRRRRKKGKSAEGAVTEESAVEGEEPAAEGDEDEGDAVGEAAALADETQGAKKKKRRRRKRGGAKHHPEEAGALEEAAPVEPMAEPVSSPAAPVTMAPDDEVAAAAPAKKRAPRKKAEKTPPAEPAVVEAAPAPPVAPVSEEPLKAAKTKKSPKRKTAAPETAAVAAAAAPPVAVAPVESTVEAAPAPAKKPRSRAKAAPASPAAEVVAPAEAPVPEAPVVAEPAEKPKRVRAPRKKKETAE
jgi:ribonuclease E